VRTRVVVAMEKRLAMSVNLEPLLEAASRNSDVQNFPLNLEVRSGQIRLIKRENPNGVTSIGKVLVVEVDKSDGFCQVMLVHADLPMRTNKDLVIEMATGLVRSNLVIQTDCLSVVDLGQMLETVAVLDERAEEALNLVWRGEFPDIEGFSTGLPLSGRSDFRWNFKKEQVAVITFFAEDCLARLLGEQPAQALALEDLDPGNIISGLEAVLKIYNREVEPSLESYSSPELGRFSEVLGDDMGFHDYDNHLIEVVRESKDREMALV